MKQIGNPRKQTAANAWGRDVTSILTTYMIEEGDPPARPNYLGHNHAIGKLPPVGRTITVYTDGTGWTMWVIDPEAKP